MRTGSAPASSSIPEPTRRSRLAVRDEIEQNPDDSFGLVDLVSLGGIGAFVVAVLALHVLNPGLNPAEHTISEYALGTDGWLMRAAFVALGIGVLGTAAGLCSGLRLESSPWQRVGLVLLVATAGGLFLDAAYNTDLPHVPETVDGTVHSIGTWVIAFSLPAAASLLGGGFLRTGAGGWRARCLLLLCPAELVAVLAFHFSPITYRGLAERVGTVMAVATLALLRSWARPPEEAPGHRRRWTTLVADPLTLIVDGGLAEQRGDRASGAEGQVLMDGTDAGGAFAHGGGDPLGRAAAHVADGEQTGVAGLEGERSSSQRLPAPVEALCPE